MTRILAVANQKGGVGKTTTSINLAAFLEMAGRRVLLIDLDPQANASSGIGAKPPSENLIARILNGAATLESSCQESRWKRLLAVPAYSSSGQLGAEVTPDRVMDFRGQIQELAVDYCILDCPPSAGAYSNLGLSLADSVVVPVQTEYFAMEGLSQILPAIERIRRVDGTSPEIEGLVFTLYDHQLQLSREVRDEVRRYFPQKAFRTTIPRDVALAEASSHGLPIHEYDPRARGTWAYLNLTKEVLSHERES